MRSFFPQHAMRRIALLFLGLLPALAVAAPPQPPSIIGRAWILGDLSSGQTLVAEKLDERVEPASLTRLCATESLRSSSR